MTPNTAVLYIRSRRRPAHKLSGKGAITVINGITRGVGQVEFRSPASGDRDGFILDVKWLDDEVGEVRVQGGMEGYIKALEIRSSLIRFLQPRSHSKRPLLDLLAVVDGVGLEVAIEKISEPGSLASDISGRVEIPRKNGKHWAAPVWFVERQGDGAKVWTSAIWLGFQGER
ncbi:hypothetical protein L202_08099 [Cryptococcus amylolentus CBS 6039]|uniref:Uncharacterized protein n=1 Tax=Cryptococcus amylolentus CBS 6039 TaxID=1295533 RepID=A0A1E3HB89_9TREE|nr:hypothetical protein L202_08099 [Cryptococcus amylolentus CBS 6039]ODN73597.1 hypothetical protein L202_08099 [Cryptococcus amylolentus CBS 6039]